MDDRTRVRIDPDLERQICGTAGDAILEMDRRSSSTLTRRGWDDWKSAAHRIESRNERSKR